jgi:hypothetical protein
VRFTGYIVGGGMPAPLRPDQRGGAPGYKWFDENERAIPELVKEIEDGRRAF